MGSSGITASTWPAASCTAVCCPQGCQRCRRHHQDQENHPVRRLVPHWLQVRYQLPSLRSSPALTTSSILCTPSVPSSTGTSVKVWRKVSSPRLVRISLPSRRSTRRSVLRPPRVKVRRKVWNDLPPNFIDVHSTQTFA